MAGTASLKVVTVLKVCEDGAPSTIAPPLKASANESLVVLDRAVVNGAPHYWAINRRGLFGVIPVAAVRVAGSGMLLLLLLKKKKKKELKKRPIQMHRTLCGCARVVCWRCC